MTAMKPNERQSERIAQWLDGRDVALSPEELEPAQRIRRREALLGGLLDVSMPPEVRARAAAALRRELQPPSAAGSCGSWWTWSPSPPRPCWSW